jgi:hypothetical protein
MFRSSAQTFTDRRHLNVSMVLCAAIFACMQILLPVIASMGLSNKTKILIARVVENVDFSDNHLCDGVRPGDRVVRLGSQGDRGIAASFGKFNNATITSHTATDAKNRLPTPAEFYSVDCNVTRGSIAHN